MAAVGTLLCAPTEAATLARLGVLNVDNLEAGRANREMNFALRSGALNSAAFGVGGPENSLVASSSIC